MYDREIGGRGSLPHHFHWANFLYQGHDLNKHANVDNREPGTLPIEAANTILKGCQQASLEIKLVRFHVWKTSQKAIEGN